MKSDTNCNLPWFAFLILLLVISWTQIADYDFWWHLNLGRQILDQGSPFVRDQFSYTFAGQPQFNGEWLGDLALYLIYHVGGIPLINVFKFALLAGTFYFLRKSAEDALAEQGRQSSLAIVIALVVVLFALRFRLFVRPFLFSYFFVAVSFWLLTRYRQQRHPHLVYWLLLVELVWANTSKGMFFGPLLVGVWGGIDLLEKRIDWRLWLVMGGMLAVSCLNPDGVATYKGLLDSSAKGSSAIVGEHQPLSVALLWGGGFAYTWGFQLLVLLGGFYFVLCKGWWDKRALILFGLFLVPAIQMIRMIDFFSLAAIFAVAPALARLFELPYLARLFSARAAAPVAAAIIILLAPVAVVSSKSYEFGAKADESNIPEAALAFLEKNRIQGRIFNSYPFGGYIPWRQPKSTVYIDGRINQLYPPDFHKHYYELIHTPQVWAEDEEKWGFEIAVIEYDRMDGGRHFPRHLADNPQWALVFWNDHSTLWLKRVPRFAQVIERYSYRLARPAFYELDYLNELLRSRPPQELLRDASHDVALNPDNQEARLAYVFSMYSLNRKAYAGEIVNQLNACLRLKPDLAIEHSALGMMLLEAGRRDEAAVEARRALQLDKADEAGLYLKGKLGGLL